MTKQTGFIIARALNKMQQRLDAAEAERDEARATLAAARTMLDATGAALAEATKRITELEAERDAAIDACKTAAAWLGSWGQHYGSCRGGNICTCGLTRNQYDLAAALEPKP
jgi:hypothetical protein